MHSKFTVIAGHVYEVRSGPFGVDVVCTGIEAFSVSDLLAAA